MNYGTTLEHSRWSFWRRYRTTSSRTQSHGKKILRWSQQSHEICPHTQNLQHLRQKTQFSRETYYSDQWVPKVDISHTLSIPPPVSTPTGTVVQQTSALHFCMQPSNVIICWAACLALLGSTTCSRARYSSWLLFAGSYSPPLSKPHPSSSTLGFNTRIVPTMCGREEWNTARSAYSSPHMVILLPAESLKRATIREVLFGRESGRKTRNRLTKTTQLRLPTQVVSRHKLFFVSLRPVIHLQQQWCRRIKAD